MANNYALSGPLDKLERGLDKLFGKEIESGQNKSRKKKTNSKILKTNNLFERWYKIKEAT